ncbi:hypothetical protein BLS_005597 [Venturia inaequalis]|uniref:Uncharacterized protein n=1 Tax=Venturia inaequalis TaxID=5025 RepID=A0A8H3YPU1_VENIN|nr:hypothetical protein BLS_005597 [Venturia inaequalis]
MATDALNVSAFTTALQPDFFKDTPSFPLARNFALQSVDASMVATDAAVPPPVDGLQAVIATPEHPPFPTTDPNILGVLGALKGSFVGSGFNTIFRPSNSTNRAQSATNPDLITEPTLEPLDIAPGMIDDNILELNLTIESLVFTPRDLGNIPNRGINTQPDVVLQGVPYVQTIWDVTNPNTGKADDIPRGIHFEPGIFLHIPSTTIPPSGATIARMASIPHGTTINISGQDAFSSNGPPPLEQIHFTTFPPSVGQGVFQNLNVDTLGTPRFPPDLTLFKENGTINQALVDDPVELLRAVNAQLLNADGSSRIIKTDTFIIGTDSADGKQSGAATSIPFLTGKTTGTPNANVPEVNATFWIETVNYDVEIPPMKSGECLELPALNPLPGASLPKFTIMAPPAGFEVGGKVTVPTTQIQYAQNVMLQFAPAPADPFNWPHVSVANLVPLALVPIDAQWSMDNFQVS